MIRTKIDVAQKKAAMILEPPVTLVIKRSSNLVALCDCDSNSKIVLLILFNMKSECCAFILMRSIQHIVRMLLQGGFLFVTSFMLKKGSSGARKFML